MCFVLLCRWPWASPRTTSMNQNRTEDEPTFFLFFPFVAQFHTNNVERHRLRAAGLCCPFGLGDLSFGCRLNFWPACMLGRVLTSLDTSGSPSCPLSNHTRFERRLLAFTFTICLVSNACACDVAWFSQIFPRLTCRKPIIHPTTPSVCMCQ